MQLFWFTHLDCDLLSSEVRVGLTLKNTVGFFGSTVRFKSIILPPLLGNSSQREPAKTAAIFTWPLRNIASIADVGLVILSSCGRFWIQLLLCNQKSKVWHFRCMKNNYSNSNNNGNMLIILYVALQTGFLKPSSLVSL